MKATEKTKQQLVEELEALRERVLELEALERDARFAQREFGERLSGYFPQVEHMNEAIYVIFDRKYEFVNRKFAELFGVTQEEVCNTRYDPMGLVAPESRRFVRDKFRQGSRGEFTAQQYEFTGLTNEGVKIECETFVLYVPYKWGIAIHGMLRNITMRKRVDQELQRKRGDLQIVLDSIPTSIFYTDRDHRFIRANKAFCKSLGMPMEQVIGKTLSELFPNLPAEQLSPFFDVNNQVMSTGHSKRGMIETFPSVRGRRWIQNDRIPCRDEAGKITGTICLTIDISDYRETEEKLWYLSFRDVLTGLYNRAYFEEEVSRIGSGRQFPISFITVNVDELAAVNDRNGIAAGNELLRRTARVLKSFRTEDVVARVGGNRFVALLPQSDSAIGENALARLREALAAHNQDSEGMPLNLSFELMTAATPKEIKQLSF
jgi:diguanylate cyclase (GGDEF)-like protein/PAS domain S-box-containing protein